MSEILIKNMELPKQGMKRLIILPDGEVREICGDEAVRATDARAVELPPHGRLGDLDKQIAMVKCFRKCLNPETEIGKRLLGETKYIVPYLEGVLESEDGVVLEASK